jgi:hypothetical protein
MSLMMSLALTVWAAIIDLERPILDVIPISLSCLHYCLFELARSTGQYGDSTTNQQY